MKTLLLILILSVTHITLAQLDLAAIAGDRSKVIHSFTDVLNNVCDQNKIKLDRQKLEAQIESCVKPHVDKIVAIATDGRARPMLGQIMGALQNQPITFSSEQRTWIKTEILAPACKIYPCVSPIKNPLTQECMSDAASKGFNYTDLYFDAICKNEGENFLALIESVNRECAQEYPNRLQSCAQKDAGLPTMRDGKLNITVTEMCGVLAKVHTCSISSVNVCGPKATQVFQNTFKDLQTWVTTSCDDSSENNQGSQSQPILGFLGMILSVFLAEKIGIHLR